MCPSLSHAKVDTEMKSMISLVAIHTYIFNLLGITSWNNMMAENSFSVPMVKTWGYFWNKYFCRNWILIVTVSFVSQNPNISSRVNFLYFNKHSNESDGHCISKYYNVQMCQTLQYSLRIQSLLNFKMLQTALNFLNHFIIFLDFL